ncbi:TPA: signal peptide peptidase SppA [Candidatus Delongbacteria bacterium]|nr:MAG: signal peptide peptidase SppA [Candidatus Delongbacteria bacterium GWF2_40_14]HAQ62369.1 signal peptide peptidase SppA [Candidatus Delongbacteria bacterium]
MDTIKSAVKWFFKTTFTVIIVFAVLFFFLAAFIAKMTYENIRPDEILKGSYLVLSFPSGLPESPSEHINLQGFRAGDINKKALTLYNVLSDIDHASSDSRIKGIFIDLDNWGISPEHTNEISSSLVIFRESGKPVTAVGSGLDKNNYQAALAADEIIMDPSSSCTIILNGYSASVPYFKDMGDKLGITVNAIHIGKYKGAGENFSRNSMSDQYKESIEKILNDRFDLFSGSVSERRGIEKSVFAGRIDKGEMVFITPQQAFDLKLVDKLMSFDDVIKDKNLKTKQLVDVSDYIITEEKTGAAHIAVIFAEGNIVDGYVETAFGDDTINPEKFEKILNKIKKNKDIKAIVLRVNSPGGSALASEKILRKITNIKQDMPVVVSMGPVAASGGYYISCQADKIFADPYTITGSIGVVSLLPNLKGISDKIGIKNETIVKGKYSDIFDLTKDQSQEDIQIIRGSMEKIYTEFKARVSAGREINETELEKIAQGQIWTGRQAKENGLVDELGGLNTAILEAKKLANLDDFKIVTYPENRSISEKIFSAEFEETDIFSGFEKAGYFQNEISMIKNAVLFANRPALIFPVIIE